MERLITSPKSLDILEIERILLSTENDTELFDKDTYLNDLIEKPWGFEYRIYCDFYFDIWRLHINKDQSTSMHCHLMKDTMLVCLAGSGYTKLIDGTMHYLEMNDSIHIPKGVFHQTVSVSDKTLQLIEIENPRNKYDLIRLNDLYGRQHTAYEKKSIQHKGLQALEQVGFSKFIRRQDLNREFAFTFVIFSSKDLVDPSLVFIILIGIKNHLSGRINVIKKKDINDAYIGEKALLVYKL